MRITIDDIEQDQIITEESNKKDNGSETEPLEKASSSYADNALELAGLSFKERQHYKKEQYKTRIASMKLKDKIFYTIRYYKWGFLSIFAIFMLACFSGWAIYHASWPTVLSVAIVNNGTTVTPTDYITNSFRDYYHLDKKNIVNVYSDLFISSTEDGEAVGTTMNDYQKIGFYNMSEMIDAIICDEEALARYAYSDDSTAIDISIPPALYQKLEDRMVTLTDTSGVKNDGKPYIGAIDISGTDFVKGCGITYDKVYLLIPSTKYTDNQPTIQFIQMIFNLKE